MQYCAIFLLELISEKPCKNWKNVRKQLLKTFVLFVGRSNNSAWLWKRLMRNTWNLMDCYCHVSFAVQYISSFPLFWEFGLNGIYAKLFQIHVLLRTNSVSSDQNSIMQNLFFHLRRLIDAFFKWNFRFLIDMFALLLMTSAFYKKIFVIFFYRTFSFRHWKVCVFKYFFNRSIRCIG